MVAHRLASGGGNGHHIHGPISGITFMGYIYITSIGLYHIHGPIYLYHIHGLYLNHIHGPISISHPWTYSYIYITSMFGPISVYRSLITSISSVQGNKGGGGGW